VWTFNRPHRLDEPLVSVHQRTKAYGIELGGDMPTTTPNEGIWRCVVGGRPHPQALNAGHVIFVAGGPVIWKSKKQTFVALSTTEAEFTNITPTAYSLQ
jgi:hypothetical protein